MTEIEQRLYNTLDLLEIEYIRYEHKAVYTIEEANQLDINIPGQQCKNLFLRNRKGDTHYLVILHEEKQADLKLLSHQIGSTSLSFASEERLFKYLGLKPGSVTPFGLINDSNKEVIVLIDKELVGAEKLNFHPNVNTATISVSYKDFEKFIEWNGNKINYVNI
ncbi:prolyl-tRNA synthetase associated domain-containing protein [Clostridium sp. SYSU_GA19001]|uniref:prolyl-tRNA synthetase associated domain-containing protein n=1 Tax=Clostridium caldaquaticum TaxID=2940653 RepID=UPI002077695C|nr:prolyl-tRNA synthetase associated domain-containing protein [Clostridium caldaquaticum]